MYISMYEKIEIDYWEFKDKITRVARPINPIKINLSTLLFFKLYNVVYFDVKVSCHPLSEKYKEMSLKPIELKEKTEPTQMDRYEALCIKRGIPHKYKEKSSLGALKLTGKSIDGSDVAVVNVFGNLEKEREFLEPVVRFLNEDINSFYYNLRKNKIEFDTSFCVEAWA